MKITLSKRRNAGLGLCAAIILMVVMVIIAGEVVWVLIKACKCIPEKNTNDPPGLVIDGPATRAFNGPRWTPPQGAVSIGRSTVVTMSNAQPIFFMTVATNADGTKNITTYDQSGYVVGSRNFNPGEVITNEVYDADQIWPNAFYAPSK